MSYQIQSNFHMTLSLNHLLKAIMREKEVMNRITASWNPEAPFFVRLVKIHQFKMHNSRHKI